jgi:hypothetical protein
LWKEAGHLLGGRRDERRSAACAAAIRPDVHAHWPARP